MNSEKKLPGYVVLLIIALLGALLATYFLTLPYLKDKPKNDQEHNEAQATIKMYEKYYNEIEDFSEQVNGLRKKWNEYEKNERVTPETVSNDITVMLANLATDATRIAVSAENVHKDQRSSTMAPLCDIPLQLQITLSKEKTISMLKYFERESKGQYAVQSLNISVINSEVTRGHYVYYAGDYQVDMKTNLYYFKSLTK